MSSVKSLYLPVEGLARELDGKLLLALVAKERGWRPVIGYKHAIRNRRAALPPGILISHNARARKPDMFRRIERFGHRTVVLDEEALVRQTDDIFMMKHNPDVFDRVDLVMTWGKDDAELWQRSGLVEPERIVTTGNPRLDMLRLDLRGFHQPDIDAIQRRFGNYVLLNTNFPTVNHFVANRSTLTLSDSVTDPQAFEQTSGFLDHKQAIFQRFLTLVPKIAKAIDPVRLIVRPHPSERHEPWLEAIAETPNAAVVAEGSVVPWIAGAHALVHNGCTSAVEAAVIGTTILSYRPVQSAAFDNPLPNGVGIECFDDDTLLRVLTGIIADGPRPLTLEQSTILGHHVTGISGALSCDRIMDALDHLPKVETSLGMRLSLWRLKRHLKLLWRDRSRRIRDTQSAEGRTRRAYINRKISEMSPQYMNERISRFQNALGRFDQRHARQISEYLFEIE